MWCFIPVLKQRKHLCGRRISSILPHRNILKISQFFSRRVLSTSSLIYILSMCLVLESCPSRMLTYSGCLGVSTALDASFDRCQIPCSPLTQIRPLFSIPGKMKPHGSFFTLPIAWTCTGHLLCIQKSFASWVLVWAQAVLLTIIFLLSPEEGFDRYKMVVQVVIGEQRGEGVK